MGSGTTYQVERGRKIAAPPDAVLERIVDFRRWTEWSPWEDLDPEQTRMYGGAEQGVGATYAWEGNRKAGAGSMEITGVDPHGTVTVELRFLRPMRSEATVTFSVVPDGEGSEITWSMTGAQTRLMRVLSLVWSMDRMLGKEFDKGLDRLQERAEAGTAG